MRDAMQAGTITMTSDGDQIEAYLAQPVEGPKSGGVVVIHHMPGYDAASKEIVRRLASYGYAALCPNLHFRDAPGADPDDAAAVSRATGGVPDERMLADVAAAAEHLRSLESANGAVGVIGFCSGGRQSVLSACRLPLDAAVDCYGAFVLSSPPAQLGVDWEPITAALPDLGCPLLGLFGEEDKNPAPAEVAELDRLLTEHGKEHDFHTFPGAGHSFFAVDRPAYRQEAATQGWQLVRAFLDRHLAR